MFTTTVNHTAVKLTAVKYTAVNHVIRRNAPSAVDIID